MKNVLANKLNLDEVVFENRNKSYGAYVLRKSYDDHLTKAAVSSLGIFLLLAALLHVASLFTHNLQPVIQKTIPTIPGQLITKFTIMLDQPAQRASKVRNNDNLRYQIARNSEVTPTVQTTANPQLPLSATGTDLNPIVGASVAGSTGSLGVTAPIEKPEAPVTFAEIMPSFNGGQDALNNYMRNELNYPKNAVENGIEGRVVVSFVVQIDGSITDIKIERGIGFGTEEEARRVIENMPKWIPGKQNGKLLPVKLLLPLQFKLQ